MERSAFSSLRVRTRQCSLGDDGRKKCSKQVAGTFAKCTLAKIADNDSAFVHEAAKTDGTAGLCQHVSQPRLDQNFANLILDRGDGFNTETGAVARILV